MVDSVIAGTGNSRYLRTSLAAGTTWEDALTMLRAGTFPIDLAGINAAGFTTVGTALTSATLLKAAVCTALGLDSDATPSDAWDAIIALVEAKQTAPESLGNAGQVLGLDSNLNPKWITPSGGGGGGTPYDSDPEPLGTASPGDSDEYARGNHVHPKPSPADIGAGTYSKPSGGIPKTDLASAVQTSLGKADTAYQKPSGGIPASDLASGVIPSPEVAWFTYGTSTSAEIEAAFQAGKVCLAVNGSRTFIFGVRGSATSHTFFSATYATVYQVKCDNNTWSNNSRPVPAGSNDTPQPLGTATSGDGTTYSRSNHVHAMPSASDVGAVAVAQGVGHSGEFLVVGSDGNVTTVTLATWQGGSF